jgi:Uma2 family endonuclease
MATVTEPVAPSAEPTELHNGDRMTQEEFHRVYSRMRRSVRAELIGGIVYMASPLKIGHGTHHNLLGTLFGIYAGNTFGVECGDNTTLILGAADEPQPDLYLRVLPECGGQSRTTVDDYVDGAPELIAEVALSSWSIDLFDKRDTYARHGALEYFVLDLRDNRLHWFDLRAGKDLAPDADGIYRIRTFPGLWVHGPALLSRGFRQLMTTLDAGLATREHAKFAQQLELARQK